MAIKWEKLTKDEAIVRITQLHVQLELVRSLPTEDEIIAQINDYKFLIGETEYADC